MRALLNAGADNTKRLVDKPPLWRPLRVYTPAEILEALLHWIAALRADSARESGAQSSQVNLTQEDCEEAPEN